MKSVQLICIRVFFIIAALAAAPCAARAADTPSPTPAASVSELLEQGIYNEETKGDIDAAIATYKQLIAQAAASDSLAAQAEFRLGQCYLKKGLKDDATATFQKLVKDFPNEKDLVAKALQLIPSGFDLGPTPWVDGERLQLKFFLPNGTEMGIVEYRANLVQSGAQSIWRVGARQAAGEGNSVSSVDADSESMRPISSRWKIASMGEVKAVYHPGVVDLDRQGQGSTGNAPVTVVGDVIDNEEAMDVFRRLPLKLGYKTTMPIFPILTGSELPLGVEVTGKETLQVPAGTFNCFRVQLNIGQTFWFSNDAHRYLVQFQVGMITAKLTSIDQRNADAPVFFRDDELGISLTAPPQWVVCRYKAGQPKGQSLIRTYDPDADSDDGGIRLFSTASLSRQEAASPKAWAEANLKDEIMGLGKDVKVRPDSWKPYTVSGRPGVGFVADYTDNGKPKTLFSLYVLGPKDSERFGIISAADKFDALMQQFDNIIASYQRQ